MCCKRICLPGESTAIQTAIHQPLKWDDLLVAANALEVTHVVWWSIKDLDRSRIPNPIVRKLQLNFQENSARNMLLSDRLLSICRTLQEQGIVFVPVKGLILADQVFPNRDLRRLNDLDILVQRNSVGQAVEVLKQNGMSLIGKESVADSDLLKGRDVGLGGTLKGFAYTLELHWKFKDKFLNLREDLLWSNLVELDWNGIKLQVFSPELTLLHLVHHLHYHGFPLKILIDVAAALRTYNGVLNWTKILQWAEECKMRWNLYLALESVSSFFEQPYPVEALALRDQFQSHRKWLFKLLKERSWYFSNFAARIHSNPHVLNFFSAFFTEGSYLSLLILLGRGAFTKARNRFSMSSIACEL